MKLERKPVTQKFSADIAQLYAARPGSMVHEPNPRSLEAPCRFPRAFRKLLGRSLVGRVLAQLPWTEPAHLDRY